MRTMKMTKTMKVRMVRMRMRVATATVVRRRGRMGMGMGMVTERKQRSALLTRMEKRRMRRMTRMTTKASPLTLVSVTSKIALMTRTRMRKDSTMIPMTWKTTRK